MPLLGPFMCLSRSTFLISLIYSIPLISPFFNHDISMWLMHLRALFACCSLCKKVLLEIEIFLVCLRLTSRLLTLWQLRRRRRRGKTRNAVNTSNTTASESSQFTAVATFIRFIAIFSNETKKEAEGNRKRCWQRNFEHKPRQVHVRYGLFTVYLFSPLHTAALKLWGAFELLQRTQAKGLDWNAGQCSALPITLF